MSKHEPIRAWAEYDEWSVYLREIDAGGIPFVAGSQAWEPWEIPKSGNDEPRSEGVYSGLVVALEEMNHGPLRSLRVLLRSGHDVELERKAGPVTVPQGRRAVMLEPGCMKFSLFRDAQWLHGGWYMPEVGGADAVRRALDEAARWLAERRQAA